MLSRHRKLIRWTIGSAAGVLVGLWIAVLLVSRAPILRERLVQTLNDKLDADVELGSLEVRTFPLLRIHGDELKLRLKGQTNPAPFIEVRHFEVTGGLFGMLRRQRRFNSVELEGLRITIPPRSDHDKESGSKAAATMSGPAVIDHLEAKDAQLIIQPKDSRKEPKIFAIHNLALDTVGFDRAMPFVATLTNAIPKGEIAATGSFGPWVARDPGSTPLNGQYNFNRADLNTIEGISGTLKSAGAFTGALSEIDVRGTTSTPDFQIDIGGEPVPLTTRFHAVVDGTNGDTYLKRVDAMLRDTPITVQGAIVSQPNVKGRTVRVDATISDGRLEDVLRLAVSAPRPVMLGRIGLQTSLTLPPGKGRVVDRLRLKGRFALARAQFTDAGVQEQLASLSRRAQGMKEGEPVGRIASNMRGTFEMQGGVLRFDALRFDLPGAVVELSGRYTLRSQLVDFTGTLGMDATVSKAMGGGIKGFLLKPFDPLFRKKGKGALIPITIKGSREQPKFGVKWGKVFK
ncbi:MAG TPA: AsmA-like C-terminal region-containing protein [Vicinamibacterales bacterium]|nr:AsmA-like C-terminal region-containing protein [Vicinamibacterales bacterium]